MVDVYHARIVGSSPHSSAAQLIRRSSFNVGSPGAEEAEVAAESVCT